LPGDERRHVLAQPLLALGGIGRRRIVQPTGLGILHYAGDRVGGVLLVRADHAARAALDPAHGVLAGQRRAVVGQDAPALVADQPAALVVGNTRKRVAAVADRAQDQAARDHLLLAGRTARSRPDSSGSIRFRTTRSAVTES